MYVIEDNINFWEEIYKNDDNDKDNCCLISGEKLDETQVTLTCGHKYNYYALYIDLLNSKNEENKYAEPEQKYYDCIQCPYCRKLDKHLMPRNIDITPECFGINLPINKCTKVECNYVLKKGKNKGNKCDKSGFITSDGKLCRAHYKKKITKKNS